MAAAKTATKAQSSNGSAPPNGQSISLYGALWSADLRFDTGEVFHFEVDGLLAAMTTLEGEDLEGVTEGLGVDVCALGRQALRNANPDHPYAGLGFKEFMSKVKPGTKTLLVPDFENMDSAAGTVLEEGHPFG